MPDFVSAASRIVTHPNASCSSLFADLRCRNLGILARRVAHDVNNSLGTVLIQSHLLRQSLDGSAPAEPTPGAMLDVIDGTVRAQAELLKQLMMLSVQGDQETSEPVEIVPIVMSACRWAKLVVNGGLEFDRESVIESCEGCVTHLCPHELEHIVLATLLQCRHGGQQVLRVRLQPTLREAGYAELSILRDAIDGLDASDEHLVVWRERIGHIAEVAGSIGIELIVEDASVPREVRVLIPQTRKE